MPLELNLLVHPFLHPERRRTHSRISACSAECDREVVRFAIVTNLAVWVSWPVGRSRIASGRGASLPDSEAWLCAKIFMVFGGRFRSETLVESRSRGWELGKIPCEDDGGGNWGTVHEEEGVGWDAENKGNDIWG